MTSSVGPDTETWTGRLFRAGLSRAETVSVSTRDQDLVLDGIRTVARHGYTIVPPIGGGYWRFDFANGDTLEVVGGEALAAALGHRPSLLSRLERSWRLALASVPVLLGIGGAAWYWGVPFAADQAAAHLPPWVERQVTQASLDLIFRDEERQSHVALARRQRLTAILADMVGPESLGRYQLHFLDAPLIGPNAFALPDGDIVVTDQLLSILDDEEVTAVLAHEVGHVRHRHGLRLALRASGLSILAAAAVGDASTAGHFLVAAPVLLLNLRFTREFETEADTTALEWLSRGGRSPCTFSHALRKIVDSPEMKRAGEIAGHLPGWLATHPVTEDRLRRFDAACPVKS